MQLHRIFLALVVGSAIQLCAKAQSSFPATNPAETNNLTQAHEELSMGDGETRPTAPPADEAYRAAGAHAEAVTLRPVPTPLPLEEDAATGSDTYMDVFNILKEENSCSRFFGGSSQAVEAFNGLVSCLQKKPLESRLIGIRMAGDYRRIYNRITGASYRLFAEATLNSDGPYYKTSEKDTTSVLIGSFPASTRQARALILLHELGHIVTDGTRQWLLPDDGNNPGLSRLNTRMVENQCIDQLLALGAGLDEEIFGRAETPKRRQ